MIKVLIVDDEPKIRNGLFEAVNWEQLGMKVIGLAKDGEEALQIATENKPDICLVDICMPFINGLDFIERLKGINPNTIPIIITGHDEFEYAQKALKLKVFDYVLKPVCEEELLKLVQKAKAELEESRDREERYQLAAQQLKKNLPVLRERFVLDWLEGHLTFEEIKEEISFYRIELGEPLGILVLKSPGIVVINNQYDEKERQLLLFALESILEEYLVSLQPNIVLRNQEENIVALVSIRDQQKWSVLKHSVEGKAAKLLGYDVCIRQSLVTNGFAGVSATYQEIQKELHLEHCLPVIQKVKNQVETYFSDPELSLHQIALEMQLSLSYLSKLFKQETGMSFIDYLIRVRIKEAIKLMNHPELKIYEIADRVGYSSQHYFCAAFKKVLGVSPTEYRQKSI